MLRLRTILHPTDFSEPAGAAFGLACSLARDHGARLLVLHVTPPPVAHGEVVARRQENGYYDELRQELRRVEPSEPMLQVEHRLVEGDPAEVILRVAVESTTDLIVMGTHGRTGLSRLVLGSVAEEVMRKAPCPVLTVRTPMLAVETETDPRVEPAQAG